jgi:hypothetical protein
MTVEFVLLMVVVFSVGFKFLAKAPMSAFSKSAPRLGALVEKNLATGTGFRDHNGNVVTWQPPN